MKNRRTRLSILWNACLLFWSLRVPVLIQRLAILNNVLMYIYTQMQVHWKVNQSLYRPRQAMHVPRGRSSRSLYTLFHETNPGSQFCSRLNRRQGHSVAGRMMSIKNSDWTRDLQACSAVPQPTVSPCSPCKCVSYLNLGTHRSFCAFSTLCLVLILSFDAVIQSVFWTCHYVIIKIVNAKRLDTLCNELLLMKRSWGINQGLVYVHTFCAIVTPSSQFTALLNLFSLNFFSLNPLEPFT